MAIMMNELIGIWHMVHDGWNGTLIIQSGDQIFHPVDGNCTYTTQEFTGTYTGSDGVVLPVQGYLGGVDSNWRGSGCPQVDHMVDFTIAFQNSPAQQFTGYLFTQTWNAMAGNTWWQGIPFGWYAQKQ